MKITDYSQKKIVDYLKDGQKNLIDFHCGLGDCLMFMPIFEKMKQLYPNIHFDLYLQTGQEEVFDCVKEIKEEEYDYVFSINFPMSAEMNISKQMKSCKEEFGIDLLDKEVIEVPEFPNPLISVHFQGTALPNAFNCPPEVAKQVWDEIKECGKIPIECHFHHCFHNPVNEKFDFIESTVRECKPTVPSLIGLIQNSFAFVGVASGPFIIALSVLPPERIFYLEKIHKAEHYTKNNSLLVMLNIMTKGV